MAFPAPATRHLSIEARQPSMASIVGFAVVAAYLIAFCFALRHDTYNVWGPLLVVPALALISAPMLAAAARHETDPRMPRLIVWALGLKLAASLVRYGIAFGVYGGIADATDYGKYGAQIGASFRRGDFHVKLGNNFVGTGFLRLLTGIIDTVTGPTLIGAFLVFSWLGFWGLYLFYRAFVMAVPNGEHRRYALLVFFLPSMLFWPSSVGKEAWMTFGIGLAAYGGARMLVGRHGGFLLFGLGAAATAVVRPHITLLIAVAMTAGFLFRPRSDRASVLSPMWKFAGVTILVVACVVALAQAKTFLGVDNINTDTVSQIVDNTHSRTDEGGSSFQTQPVSSPAQYPKAVLTVLFRPLPTEAHGALPLFASAEGMFLLALFIAGRRRLANVSRLIRRTPYLTVCVVYSGLFIYAFSGFANFGILTRERVQVLPFVLVLLALPRRAPREIEALQWQQPVVLYR
jgi:hypothetical protein